MGHDISKHEFEAGKRKAFAAQYDRAFTERIDRRTLRKKKGGGSVELLYLGAALVIGGAGVMLVSYHVGGPAGVTDFGKVLAFLGFVIYVVGRIRYRSIKRTAHGQGPPHPEEKS